MLQQAIPGRAHPRPRQLFRHEQCRRSNFSPRASADASTRKISSSITEKQSRPQWGNVDAATNQLKFPGFEALANFFKGTVLRKAKQPQKTAVEIARDELLESLLSGKNEGSTLSELVDKLSTSRLPFNEALLGGGPWVVSFTKGGRLLPWLVTYNYGKVLNNKNEASQTYDPATRSLTNRAEYFGGKVYVTASGFYTPVDETSVTPVLVEARVGKGSLHLFGIDIPLPIRGKGRQEIMYLDDTMRIFKSVGGPVEELSVVQIRKDVLDAYRSSAEQ